LLFLRNDTFEGLKIIDFGLSTHVTKLLKGICGTPGYVAPEIFETSFCTNYPGYGLEVDLFSAGVVFYKLYVIFYSNNKRMTKLDLFNGEFTNEVLVNNKECELDL